MDAPVTRRRFSAKALAPLMLLLLGLCLAPVSLAWAADASADTTGNVTSETPATSGTDSVELSGTINEVYNIVAVLTFVGPSVSGHYRFKTNLTEIALEGTISEDNLLKLDEFSEVQKKTGTFLGRIMNANIIEGSWTNADGDKTFPFRLKAATPVFAGRLAKSPPPKKPLEYGFGVKSRKPKEK